MEESARIHDSCYTENNEYYYRNNKVYYFAFSLIVVGFGFRFCIRAFRGSIDIVIKNGVFFMLSHRAVVYPHEGDAHHEEDRQQCIVVVRDSAYKHLESLTFAYESADCRCPG